MTMSVRVWRLFWGIELKDNDVQIPVQWEAVNAPSWPVNRRLRTTEEK